MALTPLNPRSSPGRTESDGDDAPLGEPFLDLSPDPQAPAPEPTLPDLSGLDSAESIPVLPPGALLDSDVDIPVFGSEAAAAQAAPGAAKSKKGTPRAPVGSSSEIPVFEADRLAEVEAKQRAVAGLLAARGMDGLLLQRPHNVAWFTTGSECLWAPGRRPALALFVTPDARVALTSDIDSAQIFETELAGLGFQLKERPWAEPRQVLADDVCRGRKACSDTGVGKTVDASTWLAPLRLPLGLYECERLRVLGRDAVHAVEATARHVQRGWTEAEIAGELAHRLMRRRIEPESIRILGDERGERFAHWSYGDAPVERSCVLVATGRRWGLRVCTARTMTFGPPSTWLRDAHRTAALVQATALHFTLPEWTVDEVWPRVRRIYEKFGNPEAWRTHEQGAILGYEAIEQPIVPKSLFRLAPRMPVCWSPRIGPALLCDTALVGPQGPELLTPCGGWPTLQVAVKGVTTFRPDILVRSA
jgi:Xaa-Pro aminopeptidase